MPKIAREGKFTIYVHPKDHPPPHVHVYYEGLMVRVSLYDLRLMGNVPGHIPRLLFDAVKRNRQKALEEWSRLNEKGGTK